MITLKAIALVVGAGFILPRILVTSALTWFSPSSLASHNEKALRRERDREEAGRLSADRGLCVVLRA